MANLLNIRFIMLLLAGGALLVFVWPWLARKVAG